MSSWQTGLAEAAAGVTPDRLDDRVLDRLRTLLLHNITVGLAAAAAGRPAARAAQVLLPAWGEGDIALVGGGKAGLLGAIFANATCMAASIQEDAWNGQHLGSALIPTGLAVAQRQGSSASHLFAALAAGYGTAMAVADRYGSATGARGFRGTAIYGQFGAAVVAGKLLNLDADGLVRALSVAANTPGGLPGPLLTGNDEVLFQSGLAAVKGTLAALAALEPIAVSPDAFDGRGYFGSAYAGLEPEAVAPPAAPTAEALAARVVEVGLRPYPLNHLCLAPVAAALDATGSRGVPAGDVESVTVWMLPGEAKGVSMAGPFKRPMQAMFSVPLAVSAALCDGGLTLDPLLARAVEPAVLGLAGRVEIRPDEGLAPLTARVVVRTATGELAGQALDPEALHRPAYASFAPTVGERWGAVAQAVAALPHGAMSVLLGALHSFTPSA